MLPDPVDGTLRLREEVTIERWDEHEMEVLASAPCRPGERLTLEVTGNGSRPLQVDVRDSRPLVAADGRIRHRILLIIDRGAATA